MASEFISFKSADTLRTERKPELTVVHDMNDYPASARCSSCGEEMPVCQRWITSSADNLAWFADKFRFHLAQEHPDWRAESRSIQEV